MEKKVTKTRERSDKNTRKHHIQGSQEVSPFPSGEQNAARKDLTVWQRQTQKIMINIQKRNPDLERSGR